MYAGMKVNWHEVLMPKTSAASSDDSLPLFLCVFSSDKGTEKITEYTQEDWEAMYGSDADFFRYGQPLIQVHRILEAGGRVMGKRIVAPDATLANLIITAEITSAQENKTDAAGNPLYIDGTGKETTTVTDTPATITFAKIKYATSTVENAKTYDEVLEKAKAMKTDSVFPLFVICDNGRGKSIKKVRIEPDYATSRRMTYMMYKIDSIEDTTKVESQRFAIYPTAVATVNGQQRNMLLTTRTMNQLVVSATDFADAFIAKLAEVTGYTVDELYGFDPLFGCTLKGKQMNTIRLDDTGIDINNEYGMSLMSGTNGKFGDAPFAGETCSDEWADEAVKFFSGEFSNEIFDLDQYKIDFCFDANYPTKVKNAIVSLANFREDFFYFRDLGLDINTLEDIEPLFDMGSGWSLSCFVADYMSVYDVIDSFSHKEIRVTMMYDLAPLIVNHYNTNIAAPVAGEFNNFIITDAIEGTLNIIPRVTPDVDQKQILDDLHVNFVNLTSDRMLAVQSTYTSQDHMGPLSFINNVLVTQRVIKAIRRYVPTIRFMLMEPDATDFSKYKDLIQDNVISRYDQFFKSITLVYTKDDVQTANKIFNASLYCYYRDFPQAEIFDVFAVEGSPSTNPIPGVTTESSNS
nr:MAG TPA: tail sheath protein [Caudoviricetes sp.]